MSTQINEARTGGLHAAVHQLKLADGTRFSIAIEEHERDEITQSIRNGSYWAPEIFELFGALTAPGGHVLDLGAHIGTFSLYAAARGCEVLAVEASPVNAALLAQSIALNNFGRLKLIHAAVSDHEGFLDFVSAGPYGFVANARNNDVTVRVRAATVEGLLQEAGWGRVDFIKMDIEGSEPPALRGMTHVLEAPDAPPILFESNGHTLHLFDRRPADIMLPLEACGYHIYMIDGTRLVPVTSAQMQAFSRIDCLAVKGAAPRIKGWPVADALTHAALVERVLSACVHQNPHERAHAARALQDQPDLVSSDSRLQHALDSLSHDRDDGVRQAAAWWATASTMQSPEAMARAIAEKDAEIERLQALVRGYEQGRFMRFMRRLDALRRRR